MIWWWWILAGFALLILEMLLPSGFFIFFFGVGALLTGIIVVLEILVEPVLQWYFCASASIMLALFCRRFLMGKMGTASSFNNNPEGREFIASEDVAAEASGKSDYRGSNWTVRNIGKEPIRKGERALIERREGFTLLIKKIS